MKGGSFREQALTGAYLFNGFEPDFKEPDEGGAIKPRKHAHRHSRPFASNICLYIRLEDLWTDVSLSFSYV